MSQRRPIVRPFPAQRSLSFNSESRPLKPTLRGRVVSPPIWSRDLPPLAKKAVRLSSVAPEWAATVETLIDDLLAEVG